MKIFQNIVLSFSIAVIVSITPSTFAAEQDTQSIAEEVIAIIKNTTTADFSNTTTIEVSAQGKNDEYSFAGKYESGDMIVKKNGDEYEMSSTQEKFSITGSKNSESTKQEITDIFFPLNLSANYHRNLLANFDTFRFAGKFGYNDVTVLNNTNLKNIVDGVMEIAQITENKWIEINFAELEAQYPQTFKDFDNVKQEISDEFEDVNIEQEIVKIIAEGVEQEILTMTKTGSNYTITAHDNTEELNVWGTTTPVITMTVRNGLITNITIKGSLDIKEETENLEVKGDMSITSTFQYGKPEITWPIFEDQDIEITKIVKMFIEFAEKDAEIQKIENQFWYNLEKDIATTPLQNNQDELLIASLTQNPTTKNALRYLFESTEETQVKNFLNDYNNLEWKFRTHDIVNLCNQYPEPYSYQTTKEKIQDVANYYDDTYKKEAYGEMSTACITQDRSKSYVPYSIDIDTESIFTFDKREDLIIFWAKVIQAQETN